jgi:3-hydroxybutyryl-CoA dehydratase
LNKRLIAPRRDIRRAGTKRPIAAGFSFIHCPSVNYREFCNVRSDIVRPAETAVDPRQVRTLVFEDLQIGMREVLMKSVMDTDVVGFAQLSGDDNPIHLCDTYAAGTKFGQRIAHGLYTASLISAVLGTRLPGPGAVYRSQTLNFHAPVRIGDVVTVIVEVVELVPKAGKSACVARR